jgi:hypothetical protein
VLFTRVRRQIGDLLIRLESVVIVCIRSLADACIEGFAAAGFAQYGHSPHLYRGREASSECEGNEASQKQWLQEIDSQMKTKEHLFNTPERRIVPIARPLESNPALGVAQDRTNKSVTFGVPPLADPRGSELARRRSHRR